FPDRRAMTRVVRGCHPDMGRRLTPFGDGGGRAAGAGTERRQRRKMRKLGASRPEGGPLVPGGHGFGWTRGEPTSFQVLDAFVAAGYNLVDTADIYSRWVPGNQGGESETILGRWLKRTGNRSRVLVATKVGMEMGPADKGLSRAYIFRAAERSLQ